MVPPVIDLAVPWVLSGRDVRAERIERAGNTVIGEDGSTVLTTTVWLYRLVFASD